MKMMLKQVVLGLVVGVVFSGCGTNHNDSMVAYYGYLSEVVRANAQTKAEVARQQTEQIKELAGADAGGATITDPNTGVVTAFRNPSNALLYSAYGQGAGRGGAAQASAVPVVSAPKKVVPWYEKLAGGALATLTQLANPAAQVWSTKYTMDAQVAMRESDNERMAVGYEYDYLTNQSMYDTMGGFGDNMQVLGESAVGNMQIMGSNYAEMTAANVENYTGNFKNDYIQVERYEYTERVSESVSNSSSSSSSTSSTSEVPEWVSGAVSVPPTVVP